MKVIIYNEESGLSIIGVPEDTNPMIIGEKNVPNGLLFKVIEESELPSDRSTRNAWECEINESNADGVGKMI